LLRREKTARAEMTALIAHLDGKLYLSPGYYLELGADILILRREEGSVVAAFSARAASPGRWRGRRKRTTARPAMVRDSVWV
jgi:hypothetical protein